MASKTEKLVACTVERDYWMSDGEAKELGLEDRRIRAGTVVEVTPDEAMTGMEQGTLKRIK